MDILDPCRLQVLDDMMLSNDPPPGAASHDRVQELALAGALRSVPGNPMGSEEVAFTASAVLQGDYEVILSVGHQRVMHVGDR